MDTSSLLFSFVGGLLSVLSPCVLPVIPIIVTGRENDSRLRPLLIVLGLGITFILMGVLSTLFGQVIAPYFQSLEKISGIIIIIFGMMFLLDLNIFKKLSLFNRLNYNGNGLLSGLVLGMTLGLIWIPCVGPVLTSILAMVASAQDFTKGVLFLSIYSIGFSIPLLIAAYSAHLFRERVDFIKTKPQAIRIISGTILVLFGIYIMKFGML